MRRFAGSAWARLILLSLLLLGSAAATSAQLDADRVRLAQLEAAYLINFARYTDWPPTGFPTADSPLVILVHADSALVKAMNEIAQRAGPITGHKIEVRGTRPQSNPSPARLSQLIAGCHVLFIDSSQAAAVGYLLHAAQAHSVLTVSNLSGFAKAGGMFELVRVGNRVVFDANPDTIRAARLGVSSRVLKLARRLAGAEG